MLVRCPCWIFPADLLSYLSRVAVHSRCFLVIPAFLALAVKAAVITMLSRTNDALPMFDQGRSDLTRRLIDVGRVSTTTTHQICDWLNDSVPWLRALMQHLGLGDARAC